MCIRDRAWVAFSSKPTKTKDGKVGCPRSVNTLRGVCVGVAWQGWGGVCRSVALALERKKAWLRGREECWEEEAC
eukprot:3233120-Rhodomonas_salina.1